MIEMQIISLKIVINFGPQKHNQDIIFNFVELLIKTNLAWIIINEFTLQRNSYSIPSYLQR